MSSVLTFFGITSVLTIIYFILYRYRFSIKRMFSGSRTLTGMTSVAFALVATQIGGATVMGTSQEAYSSGWYGLLYIIGVSIGFLILGSGLAFRMKALNISCSADLFEHKYHSILLKKIASLLSIMTIGGLLIGEIIASKGLLEGLGISNGIFFILFWISIIMYTVLGGLNAIGINSNYQLAFIMIVFTGIFGYCLWQEPSTFFTLSALTTQQSTFSPGATDLYTLISSLLMPALYCIVEQDAAQPFFNVSTKRSALLTSLAAVLVMLLFSLVPLYFGMKAKLLNVALPNGASPIIPVLALLTNKIVVVLALCGMIIAIISTVDFLMRAITSTIDVDFDFIAPTIDKATRSQLVMIVIGIGALASSYCVASKVVQILIYSYELYDSCLVVPILAGYFKKDLKKDAAIGSVAFGFLSFILLRVIPVPLPTEIVSIGLSWIGYQIGDKTEVFKRIRLFVRALRARPCSV